MGRKKTISNPDEFALSLGSYSKSNRLINSRGKSTAINLKIMAIGLQRIERMEDGTLQSVIPGQQLRAALGNYNGSFYTQIKQLCDPSSAHATITSWTTFIEETDKKGGRKFKAMVLIPTARFENGQLTLTFNKEAEDDIYNLKKNYTMLSIAQMVKMRSPYSIQMYERFKSAMDLEKSRTGNNGPYYLEYTLQELKDDLGLGVVRDVTGRVTQKEMFTRYDTFRSHVLDIIKDEISAMTSIAVDYNAIRMGIGGKVTSIQFILRWQTLGEAAVTHDEEIVADVDPNTLQQMGNELADAAAAVRGTDTEIAGTGAAPTGEPPQSDVSFNIMEAIEIFGADLSLQDVLAVCRAANNDMEAVRRVSEMVNKAPNVKNKTGWMIAALQNNYRATPGNMAADKTGGRSAGAADATDGTGATCAGAGRNAGTAAQGAGTATGGRRTRNSFMDFEQNTYDWEDLERQLLNRQ